TGQTLGRGADRLPDEAAQAGYVEIMRRLTYSRRNEGERDLLVTLSKAARPYWEEVDALADAMTRLPTISPALAGWLAKVSGNFARLLLTFHVVESIKGQPDAAKVKVEIGEDTARRARNMMVQFFIPHA